MIHTRAMTPGIKDWRRYLKCAYECVLLTKGQTSRFGRSFKADECCSHLKPGGFIELHEIHCPTKFVEVPGASSIPYFVQWSQYVVQAGAQVDLNFSAPEELENMLPLVGFTNVTVEWQKWPVGSWAKGAKNKQIGQWWAEDMKSVTRNTAALFTRILGWTPDEFAHFAERIKDEIDGVERYMWVDM